LIGIPGITPEPKSGTPENNDLGISNSRSPQNGISSKPEILQDPKHGPSGISFLNTAQMKISEFSANPASISTNDTTTITNEIDRSKERPLTNDPHGEFVREEKKEGTFGEGLGGQREKERVHGLRLGEEGEEPGRGLRLGEQGKGEERYRVSSLGGEGRGADRLRPPYFGEDPGHDLWEEGGPEVLEEEDFFSDSELSGEDEGPLHPKIRELQYLYQLYEIQQQHLKLMRDYAIPCLLPPEVLRQQQEEVRGALQRQLREQEEYQRYLEEQQEMQRRRWEAKLRQLQRQFEKEYK
jgi:hypothetical protein